MKKQGLERRITTILFLMMSLMAVILGIVMYTSFRNVFLRFYNERAQDIVRIVAKRTDWEALQPYIETGEPDEYAEELIEYYDSVKTNFTGVSYLYLFIPEDDRFMYVIDARRPEDNPLNLSNLGDFFHYTESEYKYLLPDIQAQKASTEIIFGYTDEFGESLNVWAPVFDRSGALRAMVEADIAIHMIRTDLNSSVAKIILIFMICVLAALLVMLVYLRGSIISPINRLNQSVDSYEHGDLRLELERYRHEDEIKHLAVSFGAMTKRIEEYTDAVERVTAEKERIDAELNVASQIQANMLPRIFPAFPDRKEFDLYATVTPAKEVGGDFYDFFLVDDNRLALVVADVSDKGIPAELFMVVTETIIKNQTLAGKSPKEIMEETNRQLYDNSGGDMFVKAWFGILELSTGNLTSVNAGHVFPAYCSPYGAFKVLNERKDFPLATMSDTRYEENRMTLEPGGKLFVYTDGVIEATNAEDEFFGRDRMLDTLNEDTASKPIQAVRRMKKRIGGFIKDTPQDDDITMLFLTFSGPHGSASVKKLPRLPKTLKKFDGGHAYGTR